MCPSTIWTLSRDGLNRFIQHSSRALSGVSIGFWVCHCCFQLPVTWFHHSGCSISFNHLVRPCFLPFQRHHEASAQCTAEIQAKMCVRLLSGLWVCHCCFQLPVTWFHHSRCSISFNHLVRPCFLPFQRHHEASAQCTAEIQAKMSVRLLSGLFQDTALTVSFNTQAEHCQEYQLDSGFAIAVSSYQ